MENTERHQTHLMKAIWIILSAVLIASPLVVSAAEEEVSVEQLAQELIGKLSVEEDGQHIPGVALAEGVSQITGTAISPLLGVASVGAWKWFRAEPELRRQLPWFAQPEVWGTAFVILALCFLKDSFGAAAPPLVKKPLDWAELFEDKASALVAAGAFVPLILSSMADQGPGGGTSMMALPESGLAAMPVLAWMDGLLENWWVLLPFALIMFGAVWLCSHAVNVLIALSPLGVVDAVLKLGKLAVLALVTVAGMISPWLGLIICVPIVIVCLFLAGWAFRWMMFGTIFGWDVILGKRVEEGQIGDAAAGFLARKTDDVPARTFGQVKPAGNADEWVFEYRPWMLLPGRRVRVKKGSAVVGRGLFNPGLVEGGDDEKPGRAIVVLPPRYRGREEELARLVGAGGVVDGRLVRGFKAAKHWVMDVIGSGRQTVAASS